MKNLELNQMEVLQGGDVETGVAIGCMAIGIAGLVGSVFTFGASLAFAVTLGGAFCVGAAGGLLAYNLNH